MPDLIPDLTTDACRWVVSLLLLVSWKLWRDAGKAKDHLIDVLERAANLRSKGDDDAE